MKSKYFAAFIVAFLFITSNAQAQDSDNTQAEKWRHCARGARAPVAIINHDNVLIATNSGKKLTAEQVKQAIMQAAGETRWSIASQPDGKLSATLNVRGKHTMVVEITYSSEKYSLHYKDSTNLHYAMCEGQGVIHPNYNKWVMNLKNGIQAKLQAF